MLTRFRILVPCNSSGARRAEYLQRVLHTPHRLFEDDLPEREIQQWQVAGLHESDASLRRRRRSSAVDQWVDATASTPRAGPRIQDELVLYYSEHLDAFNTALKLEHALVDSSLPIFWLRLVWFLKFYFVKCLIIADLFVPYITYLTRSAIQSDS